MIYSIDYLPRSLFGNRDYTRIDLTGDIFEILEQECHQQISSNVAHLKASCGDDSIRAAMRLAPGEAMLLLDEVCFNRLCRPVMRSLSYYTNFLIFPSYANCFKRRYPIYASSDRPFGPYPAGDHTAA